MDEKMLKALYADVVQAYGEKRAPNIMSHLEKIKYMEGGEAQYDDAIKLLKSKLQDKLGGAASIAGEELAEEGTDVAQKALEKGFTETIDDKWKGKGSTEVIEEGAERARGGRGRSMSSGSMFKGSTEHIDTRPQKLTDINEWAKKVGIQRVSEKATEEAAEKAFGGLKKLAKTGGKKLLKGLPVVGGLAAFAESGDVMAAAPIPGLESDPLGPEPGTPGWEVENPNRKKWSALLDRAPDNEDERQARKTEEFGGEFSDPGNTLSQQDWRDWTEKEREEYRDWAEPKTKEDLEKWEKQFRD